MSPIWAPSDGVGLGVGSNGHIVGLLYGTIPMVGATFITPNFCSGELLKVLKVTCSSEIFVTSVYRDGPTWTSYKVVPVVTFNNAVALAAPPLVGSDSS
tara:strand:- start:1558 stop:1854 length:297 start_codon:yes stop_codon:yes gene_type:complete